MIPHGGTAVNYVYDALNRLREIQRGAETFTYTYTGVNPLARQLTRPNGAVTDYQYNALHQLTEVLNRTSTGAVLSRHTYTYNAQDLRASEIFDGAAIPPAPAVPETNTTYTVNAVNQLLSTVGPNRTFQYDDDGNLTQGSTKDGYVFTATYDAENRMTSLQYTGSGNVLHRQEFRYSGDGLLAEQAFYENGVLVDTVRFVRNGMLAIQDRNASNAVINEYTWGLNLGGGIEGLLALKQAGQTYSYLYDGKGNVEAVLDNTQAVVAAYRYDPFGVLLAKTGAFEQPYGFSTKRYNAPVGMVQYEFRNYWPEIGLWDRRDPLGEAGGLNLYAFVGQNPVNWVDPWGEVALELTLGVVSGDVVVPDPLDLAWPKWAAYALAIPVAQAIDLVFFNEVNDTDEDDDCDDGEDAPTWPDSPEEMDDLLDTPGEKVSDGPTTPGRNKVTWKPNKDTKITYEEHPYHHNAPDWHKGPHWHLDTPGKPHIRYLPGENIPGY